MLLYKHIPLYLSSRGELFCKDFRKQSGFSIESREYQAIGSQAIGSFSRIEPSTKNIKRAFFYQAFWFFSI